MASDLKPSDPFDLEIDAVSPKNAAPAAYQYARSGYRVFRCVGKTPAVAWQKNASNEVGIVAKVFRGRTATDNVAVVVPYNMVVIDVDVKDPTLKGVSADDHWLALCRELRLKIPSDVPICESGGGGLHIWFRLPENKTHGNSPGNMPLGFDIRGGGKGYLVCPPSLHPDTDQYYRWRDGHPLCDTDKAPVVPKILLDVIQGTAIVPGMPAGLLVKACRKAVSEIRAAEAGSRNETLNSVLYVLSRKWAGGGRSVEELRKPFEDLGVEIGLEADEVTATVASALEAGEKRPLQQISLLEEGKIPATPENIGRLLSGAEMYGVLGFNIRKACVEVLLEPPWGFTPGETYPRPFSDSDGWAMARWLNRIGCQGARPGLVMTAAVGEAAHNPYDRVVEFLDELPPWDGEERISTWLTDMCEVEDTPLHRAYGRKTLIAAVARAYRPGCKVDTCLILCGGQGKWKSSAIEALATAEFFSDEHLLFEHDVRLRMAINNGQWLHEIKEVDQFRKVDQGRFKAIMDSKIDKFVPMYGRFAVEMPRRSIFIGTANSEELLRDPTGSRRFWPVTVGSVDYQRIKRLRSQIWAEAKEAFAQGENWWLDAELEAARSEEASDYEVELIGADTVLQYLRRERPVRVTIDDILDFLPRVGLMGTPSQHFGALMKSFGWERVRVRDRGRRVSAYVPPEGFYDIEAEPDPRFDVSTY